MKQHNRGRASGRIPPIEKLISKAASDVPTSEGALWIATEAGMHVLNAASERDSNYGRCVPQQLHILIKNIYESICNESARPVSDDRIYQAVKLCFDPVKKIVNRPRSNITKKYIMQPYYAAKGLDHKCIEWMSKLPGRNFKEKLGGKVHIQSLIRLFTEDTLENRVFKKMAQSLVDKVCLKLSGFKDTAEYGPENRIVKDLKEFNDFVNGSRCRSFLENISALSSFQPNNVLLSDKNYSKVWRVFQWLKNYEDDISHSLKNCRKIFFNAMFWSIISSALSGNDTLIFNEPVIVSDGYNGSEYGIKNINAGLQWDFSKKVSLYKFSGLDDQNYVYDFHLSYSGIHIEKMRLIENNKILIPKTINNFTIKIFFECKDKLVSRRGLPIKIDNGSQFFETFADIEGIRQVCSMVNEMLELKKHDNNLSTELHIENIEHLGFDLCKKKPALNAEGAGKLETDLELFSIQYELPDGDGHIVIPAVRGIHNDFLKNNNSEIISLSDLFEDNLNQNNLSIAANNILGKISGSLSMKSESFTAYSVPDDIDEFSQKIIRSSMNVNFSNAYPVWRSVASALAWNVCLKIFPPELKEGDRVLLLDTESNEFSLSLLIARHDKKIEDKLKHTRGIYWERHQIDLQSEYDDVLTLKTIYKNYINKYIKKYFPDINAITTGRIGDYLLKSGTVSDIITEKNVFYLPMEKCVYEFKFDEHIWLDVYGKWMADFKEYLSVWNDENSLIDCYFKENKKQAVYILLHGNVFLKDFEMNKNNNDSISGENVIIADALNYLRQYFENARIYYINEASTGCLEFINRNRRGLLSWIDKLPDLSLEIIRNGRFDEIELIKDEKVKPIIGFKNIFDVKEEMVLSKDKAFYRFSLMSGVENKRPLKYEALLRTKLFPLKSDLKVKLQVSYLYGYENSYGLRIIPVDPACAGFPHLDVEWVRGNESLSREHIKKFIPVFPNFNLWESPEIIDNTRKFVDTSKTLIKLCASAFNEEFIDLKNLDKIFDILQDDLIPAAGILWGNGKNIYDAPQELKGAFNKNFITWLLNLSAIKDDLIPFALHKNKEIYINMKNIRHRALRLLCIFHCDSPEIVTDFILTLLDKNLDDEIVTKLNALKDKNQISIYFNRLTEIVSNIAYLVGNGKGNRNKLTDKIINVLFKYIDNPMISNILLKSLAVALWKNPFLIYEFGHTQKDIIIRLIQLIHKQFMKVNNIINMTIIRKEHEDQIQNEKNEKKFLPIFISRSELLLALLRLRDIEGYHEILSPNNNFLSSISKLTRRIDVLFSRLGWNVVSMLKLKGKPDTLNKMSDISYALNYYITCQDDASYIQVTDISEE